MAKILAVDDDPVILRLLEVNLGMEGHDVDTAGDGEEALERLAAFKPDLVLLDIMMPKKDGWEVCQEIKADPVFSDVPVVFLSARARGADIDRGTELGAAAYVTKPFDPVDLVDLVNELVAPA